MLQGLVCVDVLGFSSGWWTCDDKSFDNLFHADKEELLALVSGAVLEGMCCRV